MPGRLAAGLAAASLVLGAVSVLAAPPALGAPATTPDPSDRTAMRMAWTTVIEPTLEIWPSADSDLWTCEAGTTSPQMQDATLAVVNLLRGVAGVGPVTFSPSLSAKAQEAALLVARNNEVRHDPPTSWPCWSQEASDGAAHSNLSRGWGTWSVLGYAGGGAQRRWLLDPRQTTMGSGSFGFWAWDYFVTAHALYVRDEASFQPVPDSGSPYVAWPAAGYMPIQVARSTSWSLSATDFTTDFSAARVTVNGISDGITVHHPPADGTMPTLEWVFDPHVEAGDADRSFDVVVSGVVRRGHPLRPVAYTVTLFDAEDPPVVVAHQRPFAVVLDDRFDASFSATDQDGVAEVQETVVRQHAGTGTRAVEEYDWIPGDALTDTVEPLEAGDTTCVSVRARDTIGELSLHTAPTTCRHTPLDDAALEPSGTWKATAGARFWKGTATGTEERGALLRSGRVVNITRLGLVATTCRTCGTVDVFLRGRLRGSLSLESATTRRQQVLRLPRLARTTSGRVDLVVRSAGRKVLVDGLVVS